MAMNRIIFGEIRDSEAAEAFVDVCASGHPGLSTIHGRNAADAVTRLELFLARAQKSADRALLAAQVATAVQVIVVVDVCKVTGSRRIVEVREIGPVADGVMRHRDIFSYSVLDGHPQWRMPTKVSAFKEAMEKSSYGFRLALLPEILELPLDVSYREAAFSMVR
jgi:Flp pilus assembly CpaF family ATPase